MLSGRKFCEAMDMEELLDDPRYATNESRGENYDTSLRKIIADKFKDMTKWEVEACLDRTIFRADRDTPYPKHLKANS